MSKEEVNGALSMSDLLEEKGLELVEAVGSAKAVSWHCSICNITMECNVLESKCSKCGDALAPLENAAGLQGATIAGRYEILEAIGSGANGVVYKAKQLGLDRIIAIKVLHRHLSSDKERIERFKQEALSMRCLLHENIVQIFDYGLIEGQEPFIAMELLEARSLANLPSHARTDLESMKNLLTQLLAALSYAHEQGVIHRDIKPSNVLIQQDERGRMQAKLLDFGIARLASAADEDSKALTKTGELLGTPLYMSPEQCTGDEVDARSDLYSLGVLIYELWSGAPPFMAKSSFECMMKQVKSEPPALRFANGELAPLPYQQFVARALAKEKDARFQNARQMAEALAELKSDGKGQKKFKPSKPLAIAVVLFSIVLFGTFLFLQKNIDNTIVQVNAAKPDQELGKVPEFTPVFDSSAYETGMEKFQRELKEIESAALILKQQGRVNEAKSLLEKVVEFREKAANYDSGLNSKDELHLVSVMQGKSKKRFDTSDQEAIVRVTVKKADLLLVGDSIKTWNLRLSPGVRLRSLYNFSGGKINGLPPGVSPIGPEKLLPEGEYSPFREVAAYDSPDTYGLLRFMQDKFKVKPVSMIFRGDKNASYVVGPENSDWRYSHLLSRLASTYEQATQVQTAELSKLLPDKFWAIKAQLRSDPAEEAKPLYRYSTVYGQPAKNLEYALFDFQGPFRKAIKSDQEYISSLASMSENGPLIISSANSKVLAIDTATGAKTEIRIPSDIPDLSSSMAFCPVPETKEVYCLGTHLGKYNISEKKWTILNEFHSAININTAAFDSKRKCFYAFTYAVNSSEGCLRHLYKLGMDGHLLKDIPLSRPIPTEDNMEVKLQAQMSNGYLVGISGPGATPASNSAQRMFVIEPETGRVLYLDEVIKH